MLSNKANQADADGVLQTLLSVKELSYFQKIIITVLKYQREGCELNGINR